MIDNTATKRLRAMLDERGIHWWAGESEDQTRWESRGLTWEFEEGVGLAFLGVCENAFFGVYENDVTPEQAIAATVGAGTLTAEQVRECVKGVYFEGYSDGATHRANGIEETDWQAIADKLNATVGAGTCKNVSTTGNFRCSECDATDLDFDKPTYCHGCGRKVVAE